MNKSAFRVGIVGVGGIASSQHIPAWKKIPGVEIVGLVDVQMERARHVAQQNGISHVFDNCRDLVKTGVDAIDICTPNRAHTPPALEALDAGVHVLCEKPLAVTTDEVRQLGELADRKQLKLMTAQFQRFTESAVAIKGWADSGGLGDVYHARVRATRRAWLPPRPGLIDKTLAGGGPCMDVGVHALDACMWIMNFPKPVRVTGTSKVNFAKGNKIPGLWGEWDRSLFSVEDFAAGFVHFENGATMTLEASWLGHQAENEDLSFQVFGTNGGIKWPSTEFATVHGKMFAQGTLTAPRSIANPYEEEIKAFHDCVVHDKPSPVPWTETLKVIAILEGIYASQEKGREIEIRI